MREQVIDRGGVEYCMLCLTHFGSKKLLEKHMRYCAEHEPVTLKMLKKGSTIQFINHDTKLKFPVAVYADFESVLEPIKTCQPSQENSYTIQRQKHMPCSFYYIIKFFDDNVNAPIERKYNGKNAEELFLDMLTKDIQKIHQNIIKTQYQLK